MKNVIAFAFLVVTSVANAGLINGGFEDPAVLPGSVNYPITIPGWQTTDSAFEVWGTGFLGVSSFEGGQHVELNAFIAGTLFQDAALQSF